MNLSPSVYHVWRGESFSPTFTELSARVLIPTCSTGGSSCHSGEGARGDLVLDNTAHSYGALADFIEPGDAESSELMVRLEITGEDWSMPIGNQLDAGERCAIQKWIDAGAAQD